CGGAGAKCSTKSDCCSGLWCSGSGHCYHRRYT
uniref:Acatoxin 1 n=1 Tax=Anthopleura cascaia TaxID=2805811 RepID=ACTX1_ANTCS|nr:RecName: Full=Acatoxin 1; Short=Acatx1 [Anthopleura cascaia]6NK9_A Chain A, Aca Toxin 1 [Anthopleura]